MLRWFLAPYLAGLAVLGALAWRHWTGDEWRPAVLWSAILGAWLIGYWGVVTPVWTLVRLRRIWRVVREAAAQRQAPALAPADREFVLEQAVDLVVRDSGIPRFLARRLVGLLLRRLAARGVRTAGPPATR